VSLRLRLLVAVGLIALVALVLADVATYSALRSSLYGQVDQELAQQPPVLHLSPLTGQLSCPSPQSNDGDGGGPFGNGTSAPGGGTGTGNSGTGNSGSGTTNPNENGNGQNFSNLFAISYIGVANLSGKVVNGLECPAYVGEQAYRPDLPSPITGFSTQPNRNEVAQFTTGSTAEGGPPFRVRATRFALSGGGLSRNVLVQAQTIVEQTNTLHTLLLIELAVTAGALVLALLGGWWLVRLGLRPLEDVEATAESIAAGDLDQRVPGADQPTEVGRLARALNVMLERIQAAFAARVASEQRLKESQQHLRQFVADASHELRTPIAAVSAYAELFERGAAERSEDLPRVVTGIRTETARMDRLVNDLLTLARLDEGLPIEHAPVELVSLVSEAVRTAAAVGPEWPVRFSATRPVEASGDKDRLRQVIDNLLANVRAHTPPGTRALVSVDEDDAMAAIVVADEGPGMPSEDARRVFERFYRSDPARARTSGGSGLGLSIVSAIVAAHGGTVSATSAPGQGMTVTVRLPVAGDPAEIAEPPDQAESAGDGLPGRSGPADGRTDGTAGTDGTSGSDGTGGTDGTSGSDGADASPSETAASPTAPTDPGSEREPSPAGGPHLTAGSNRPSPSGSA
jgi:two-component system, OmpR family, sensor kinase